MVNDMKKELYEYQLDLSILYKKMLDFKWYNIVKKFRMFLRIQDTENEMNKYYPE